MKIRPDQGEIGPQISATWVASWGHPSSLKETAMSGSTTKETQKIFSRVGVCLLGTAGLVAALGTTASDAQSGWHPEIIRGAGQANPGPLRLAYQASFPNGSLDSSVDHLGAGPMVPGDPLIPDSNPTVSALPGEVVVSIHRPFGLSPDLIPSESIWATPVHFGPGSVVRISATYRAPVGPLPGGGFAIGLVGRTGAKDDLPNETRVATTINVRPGFLVRLNVPFGSTTPTNIVLPQAVKDAIFSTSDPQPFTLSLTIDRIHGTGKSVLKVGDKLFSLSFALADFRADGGPIITAVGPGIAVNSNGPGQTASVHVRDFRIYTNVGG
jgi:hypothetical protein